MRSYFRYSPSSPWILLLTSEILIARCFSMSRISISPVRSTVRSSATRLARVCHKEHHIIVLFVEWYINILSCTNYFWFLFVFSISNMPEFLYKREFLRVFFRYFCKKKQPAFAGCFVKYNLYIFPFFV